MYLTEGIVADQPAQVQNKRLINLRYGSPEQASRKSQRRQGEFLFFSFFYRLQGRISHSKSAVKSYETSGFYISIHPNLIFSVPRVFL